MAKRSSSSCLIWVFVSMILAAFSHYVWIKVGFQRSYPVLEVQKSCQGFIRFSSASQTCLKATWSAQQSILRFLYWKFKFQLSSFLIVLVSLPNALSWCDNLASNMPCKHPLHTTCVPSARKLSPTCCGPCCDSSFCTYPLHSRQRQRGDTLWFDYEPCFFWSLDSLTKIRWLLLY